MSEIGSNQVKGIVFDIQRFSIHDGPGIRTTVFLKGCPLKCCWCHNPESIVSEPLLSFLPDKCIGCGQCVTVCPTHAHRIVDGKHLVDRVKCTACGKCAEDCCSGALGLCGYEISVADAMAEVLSDRPFYETSQGGMTLSGGEPLAQIDFAESMFRAAKEEGMHTCCDTSGHVDGTCFERILEFVDLFLFDVKDTVPDRHRANTGVDSTLIMQNLRNLHDAGAVIHLRIPLVPEYNDMEDNLEGLVKMLQRLPKLQAVEIMPYHKLGTTKLERFGIPATRRPPAEPPSPEQLRHWVTRLRQGGVNVVNPTE